MQQSIRKPISHHQPLLWLRARRKAKLWQTNQVTVHFCPLQLYCLESKQQLKYLPQLYKTSKQGFSVVFRMLWHYHCLILSAVWRWPLDINTDEHTSLKAPLGRRLILCPRKPRPIQIQRISTVPKGRSSVLLGNNSCFVRHGRFWPRSRKEKDFSFRQLRLKGALMDEGWEQNCMASQIPSLFLLSFVFLRVI